MILESGADAFVELRVHHVAAQVQQVLDRDIVADAMGVATFSINVLGLSLSGPSSVIGRALVVRHRHDFVSHQACDVILRR